MHPRANAWENSDILLAAQELGALFPDKAPVTDICEIPLLFKQADEEIMSSFETGDIARAELLAAGAAYLFEVIEHYGPLH